MAQEFYMALSYDDHALTHALIAADCPPLALPSTCTFAPVHETGHSVNVREHHIFSHHERTKLPCDAGCAALGGHVPGKHHWIHCLTLQPQVSDSINKSLFAMALEAERSEAGIRKTNVGGFQSAHHLFEPVVADANVEVRRLHMVVSAAITEVSDMEHLYADAASRPRAGEPHRAYAWLNCNRASDYNALHVHDRSRWSAVYFVSAGEYGPGGKPGGQLILRGGGCGSTTHSFLAVHPVPGTLWLFPGSVPHTVLGAAHELQGIERASRGKARVSVAVNFVDARVDDPF